MIAAEPDDRRGPHCGRLTRDPLKEFQQDARILLSGNRLDARDEIVHPKPDGTVFASAIILPSSSLDSFADQPKD